MIGYQYYQLKILLRDWSVFCFRFASSYRALFSPFVLLPVELFGFGELLHLLSLSHIYPHTTTLNMDDFDMLNAPAAGNGVGSEEDPAAAFLAQQESEIAGIENDEGFSILDSGEVPSSLTDSNGVWLLWSSGETLFNHLLVV